MSTEENKEKVAEVAGTTKFRRVFTGLGILFIIITFFVAIKPDIFTKYGYVGVFVLNTIGSGLVLIPSLSLKFNLLLLVLVSALGNLINTSINYFVGYSGRASLPPFSIVEKTKHLVERFGLFVVYLLAITPLPLDFGGLLSGYLHVPYKKYIVVNLLGKVTIFFLVGYSVITIVKK